MGDRKTSIHAAGHVARNSFTWSLAAPPAIDSFRADCKPGHASETRSTLLPTAAPARPKAQVHCGPGTPGRSAVANRNSPAGRTQFGLAGMRQSGSLLGLACILAKRTHAWNKKPTRQSESRFLTVFKALLSQKCLHFRRYLIPGARPGIVHDRLTIPFVRDRRFNALSQFSNSRFYQNSILAGSDHFRNPAYPACNYRRSAGQRLEQNVGPPFSRTGQAT